MEQTRPNCKRCNKAIVGKIGKIYCTDYCRKKVSNDRNRQYNTDFQRRKRGLLTKDPSPDRTQCLICRKFYKLVGAHIAQTHSMEFVNYKRYFNIKHYVDNTP